MYDMTRDARQITDHESSTLLDNDWRSCLTAVCWRLTWLAMCGRTPGDVVLKTIIPRSVRVSEAPSYGQSVITYDPASSGAVACAEAARELAMRSGSM
jgi:cellulose biosynthesis protein BcsQ